MPNVHDLPTASPATVQDLKDILSLPALTSRLGTVESEVSTLETTVNTLGTRTTSTESGLSTHNTRINALESNVVGLDSRLDSAENRLNTLETSVGNSGGSTLTVFPNTATTNEDVSVRGNLLANDTTIGGVLRVLQYYVAGDPTPQIPGEFTTIPSVGDIIIYPDGEWSFEPGLNYNGPVPVITYMATNGTDIRLSTLSISIINVDDAPIANINAAMTAINEAVTFGVLGNDFDPENNPLTLTHVNNIPITIGSPVAVPNGTVVVNPDLTLTFTPVLDYTGTTIFDYTVSDGNLSANGGINIQVGFDNIPLFSPVAPIIEGDYFDEAARNFGNTALGRVGSLYNNGVNVSESTYTAQYGAFDLNSREPWLYDRPTQIYKLYLRTRDPTIRAKALELAELYMSGVVVTFELADFRTGGGTAGDAKYLYPIIAWWYERETGDGRFRSIARGLYNQARASFPAPYQAGAALWTERHINYAMQACLAQYWLTGEQIALVQAEEYFTTLRSMAAVSGAPLHPHSQHEGDGITSMVTSPWMSAVLVETLLQLYRTNGDERIVTYIARYCDFLLAHAFYVNNVVPEFLGLRIPGYLVGISYIDQDSGPEDNAEHCYDVANLLLKGMWAKQRLGQSITAMQALVNELFTVSRAVMDNWTRNTVGLPKYRVNPPRKYGWWFNGAYSRIYFAGVVPLGPINNVLPSVTGVRPVGATLTVIPGQWSGSPAPTLTYQWRRNGVDILNASGTTYITVVDDVGLEISVSETAVNVGGTLTRFSSNSLIPTAIGSPVITQQPTSTLSPPNQDVTFSIIATGSPTPSYQWYRKPKGSTTFNVVLGATQNTLTVNNVIVGMSGDRYYCQVSNTGDTIISDTVSLYVTVQLDAIRFNGSQGAVLTQSLLPPGAANFTIEALIRIDGSRVGDKRILTNRYIADRMVSFGVGNNFPDYTLSIGDTQTGWVGGFLPIDPVQGDYYFITISADAVLDTGLFRGTIQAITGGTVHTSTRDKGIDGLLGHVGFEINGGGNSSAGISVSYQYVRAYSSERTFAQVDADRNSVAAEETLFWWVFENDGAGGVTVRDASGNNRVPTLIGGALTTGPIAPAL
jgi:hypothetical protein